MNLDNDIEEIKEWQIKHQIQDDQIHADLRQFIKDCEPMLKVFKDNEVFQVQLEKKGGKLLMYAKDVGILFSAYIILRLILEKINIHLP